MPLVVEDGTGKADAVSYQDAASVTAYLTARGLGAVWNALTDAERDIACVLSTDYLDNAERFVWRGTRLIAGQALAWPRTNAIDDDGRALIGLPVALLRAHSEVCGVLAARKASKGLTPQALQPVLGRGGRIVSQSGAGFSQTFASDAPSEDRLVMVHGLVKPLVTTTADVRLGLFSFGTDDLTAFDPE